ncbi:hypothetical protein B0H10DRAFT_2381968 [Mycena sp. CBHHK59/15]|nr:hypothetical protein B0H10DRAFT_2381968 [Mycena sp. CBHHK59/15]
MSSTVLPVQRHIPTIPIPLWMLPLAALFPLFLRLTSAVQINHTIDDADPLVQYRAIGVDRNLTGFNSSQLNNGTVTFIPASATDEPTIGFNFTGTAVYIYIAYPTGHNESFAQGFVSRIDGVPRGGFATSGAAPFTRRLAYHNTSLANAPHDFVMQLQKEWELYFDYAVYTSGDAVPAASSNHDSKKSRIGAIVGGVLGALILLGLGVFAIMPALRRRRRRAARPFVLDLDAGDVNSEKHISATTGATPFTLQASPSARPASKKNALRLGIPPGVDDYCGLSPSSAQSPSSAASEPALAAMAHEMRRLTASVQRLQTETGPPAYGATVGEQR